MGVYFPYVSCCCLIAASNDKASVVKVNNNVYRYIQAAILIMIRNKKEIKVVGLNVFWSAKTILQNAMKRKRKEDKDRRKDCKITIKEWTRMNIASTTRAG